MDRFARALLALNRCRLPSLDSTVDCKLGSGNIRGSITGKLSSTVLFCGFGLSRSLNGTLRFALFNLGYPLCNQVEDEHSGFFVRHDQQVVSLIQGEALDEHILNVFFQGFVILCLIDLDPP